MPLPWDPLSGLPRATARNSTAGKVGAFTPVTVGSMRSLEPTHAIAAHAYGAQGILDTPTAPITIPKQTPPPGAAAAPRLTPAAAPAESALTPAAGPSPADLQALIEADPFYKQTQADIAAARASDQATLTAQRQRTLVQYGSIPDFGQAGASLGLIGDVGGDITDTTRQLADQNTSAGLSTTARLKQASDDVIRQIKDQLTGRGLLSSGETGYQLGRQDLSSRQASYDALQSLLDALAGYQGSYLTHANSLTAQLAAAAQAAAGRIPSTTGASSPNPGWQAGLPIDAAGNPPPANIGDYPWLAAHPGDPGYGLTALPVPDEPFQPVAVGSNVSFEPHLSATAGAAAYGATPTMTALTKKKKAAADLDLIQQAYNAATGRNRFG